MRLHAENVSVGESGDEYFQVSFDSEALSDDDFDPSADDKPSLLVQRQFEDDDGGVCYIETRDHETYTGHFRLRLLEFTPTRLAFESCQERTHVSQQKEPYSITSVFRGEETMKLIVYTNTKD